MRWFWQKKDTAARQALSQYFKVTSDENGFEAELKVDDKDVLAYLTAVGNLIHNGLDKAQIVNYLSVQASICGTPMEIALIRKGRMGPHEQLTLLKAEVKRLLTELEAYRVN